jgi:hypothetical protein
VLRKSAFVLVVALGLTVACAEHLGSLSRVPSWSTGIFFWPPRSATSNFIAEPAASTTLGDAARAVEGALRRAGYADQRWFPIGGQYEHGFAVTTRLERIDKYGTPKPTGERWLPQYPDAASLLWLGGSTEPYLPTSGRYRVLLIAFTDLHIHVPGRPARLDESTAMDGPGFPRATIPSRRHVPPGYRVGVYVYEFEATSDDGEGKFVPRDADLPASAHLERSGLSALKRSPI